MFKKSKIVFDNLGYHYHHKIYFYNDQYFCKPFWVIYINELASRSKTLTIFSELIIVTDKYQILNLYPFANNVKVVDLGFTSCPFKDKFKKIKDVRLRIKNYLSSHDIDQIIFEVPSFFSIYIYKFFRSKSVFFVVGDMVRCLMIDFRGKSVFNIKSYILLLYYCFDKFLFSHYSNKEISFGGTYRGFFKGSHFDQYSRIKNNCEAHAQSYRQCDVVQKTYNLKTNSVFTLLTVFRLSPEKNINSIIKCALLLKSNGVKFLWNILGDGPSKEIFQNIV